MLRMLICCPTQGQFDIEKANSGSGVGPHGKMGKEKKKKGGRQSPLRILG